MKISNVEDFLKEMDNYNAEYMFDIEDGWTHEDVCKNSYTDERLNWLFKHTRESETGVADVFDNGSEAVKVMWFSVSGQKLANTPKQKGIYIKTSIYANGSVSSEKHLIN